MGEYEKYQVTEYDIRQSIIGIAFKVFDIADRMEAGGDERLFPEVKFPEIEVFRRPEKEFKELISKELLGWIALHLAAQAGSEALVHSEEYERSDNEPIYQIWTPEYIKKHSEFAFYGLGGNETACVKSYLIKIEALKWINRIIGEQAGKPAEDQDRVPEFLQTNELSTQGRCLQFIENRHRSADGEDLRFYEPGKGGRKLSGVKTQDKYVSELYEQFKKDSPVRVALSVFKQAFKGYKSQLNGKKE